VELFGGAHGIIDKGVVEAALARPVNRWHYEGGTIPELAAVYLYAFATTQGFMDGNKRTALAASLAFLTANDYTIDVTNDELFALTIIVARKEMPEAALIAWFKEHARPHRARL